MKKDQITSYKFSDNKNVPDKCPDIFGDKSPIEFLNERYSGGMQFGLDNLLKSGVYRIHGWAFDFSPLLKRFLAKQHDQWNEYYAPNKTGLRKAVYERIDEIIEIDKKD
jgi:hypothetical protein